MTTARELAHVFEHGYDDCPGPEPKASGHSYSCDTLTAAISARDAELVEACARIAEDPDWLDSMGVCAAVAARIRALLPPGR